MAELNSGSDDTGRENLQAATVHERNESELAGKNDLISEPTLGSFRSISDLFNIRWLRISLYLLLLVSALLGMSYRLLHTQRMVGNEASPMLSANDRSRWLTIRSLAERGKYDIDIYTNDPIESRHWNTIDKVVHQTVDGQTHQYSSKPPMLATVLTIPTLVVMQTTGWDFKNDLFPLARSVIWLCQILPLLLTLAYFAYLLERLDLRSATKLFLLAAACWGTFVTTFAVSLNNHHFAVLGVYWTTMALLEIAIFQKRSYAWFLVVGFAAAWTAANELPALSFLCVAVGLAFLLDRRRTLLATVPAVAIIAFASFGTTLVAHHSLRPPYAHRSDGEVVLKLPLEIQEDLQPDTIMPADLRATINTHADKIGFQLTPATVVEPNRYPLKGNTKKRWVIRDYFLGFWARTQWRGLALTLSPDGKHWELRKWDNWYDYPGSYWHDGARKGVDVGQANPWQYAFDCLIGHHGIFSLTPIWLLTVPGLILALGKSNVWRYFSAGTILLSVVVIGFYLLRPQLDRNFGGQTSALRWLFWLSPLWLVGMIPATDKLMKWQLGRWICLLLLITSAASALSSAFNPWVHPWIYQWVHR